MQKQYNLKTDDDHIIYGTLDSVNSNKLIIFVHGITGHQNEHHYFNAAPFFNENSIDTFRFNFYSRSLKARSLYESSLKKHIEDLQFIIDDFEKQYTEIILVGHSLGAIVILNLGFSNISKIILWDPSNSFTELEEMGLSYNKELDKYIHHGDVDAIVGKQIITEWMSSDMKKLINNITVPCKFIFAGANTKHQIWGPYIDNTEKKIESVIVKNATHGFIEKGVELELFKETLQYIK